MVENPAGAVGQQFMELGAAVVREVAKLTARQQRRVYFDEQQGAIVVQLPGAEELLLKPATVRRHDTSATSVNEWTGVRSEEEVPEDVKPQTVNPLGNYAVQISWEDGFNQVASFELLDSLRHLAVPRKAPVAASVGGVQATADFHL